MVIDLVWTYYPVQFKGILGRTIIPNLGLVGISRLGTSAAEGGWPTPPFLRPLGGAERYGIRTTPTPICQGALDRLRRHNDFFFSRTTSKQGHLEHPSYCTLRTFS